ncbi:MAG TPA: signal peptidase I [Acidimicrobiales bacterium]|jgi:signal peptidase I|nr:signal peptidase I [Acidimicrobiales bacterium]
MTGSEPTDQGGPTSGGTRGPRHRVRANRRRLRRHLIEWATILVAVVALTLALRAFVVQTFSIPSPSMVPTLQVGDKIIVDKLSYDFDHVHRGDIVVFHRPPLESPTYNDLVKRVIGLPGETISSLHGAVYIDGKRLSEPWLPNTPSSFTGAIPSSNPQFNLPGPVKIPAGVYFVMGDNRTDSGDSRFFGPISGSLIVGRVVAVVWPLGQWKGV